MQRLDQIGRLFRRGSDPPQRARRQRVSTQDVVRAFDGEPFALEHGQYLPQQGVVALSKTVSEARVEENLAIFDFELSADEMAAIRALARPDGRIVSPEGLAPVWDEAA